MSNEVAIKVSHVSKAFKLPHEKQSSIKGLLVNLAKGGKGGFEKQEVLRDISFNIKKGEFFGIVGRNGSGKSTMLKMLAGIYKPTSGNIEVNGKLTPFIELGVGFNPELTGRENVFLNGALLGFSRKEMESKYFEIVNFAELERFMDQKLKNYSSGMQVRLAFSIAIQAQTDILLLDEVLAVGDAAFQRKCYDYFVQLKKNKRTVILVTHDMSAIENFCDRALLIQDGLSEGVMTPAEAARLYNKINSINASDTIEADQSTRWGSGEVRIDNLAIKNGDRSSAHDSLVTSGKPLSITFSFKANKHRNIVVGLAFIDQFGVTVAGPNSMRFHLMSDQTVTYSIPRIPLSAGTYRLTAVVFDDDVNREYDHWEDAALFEVTAPTMIHGKVDLYGEWKAE